MRLGRLQQTHGLEGWAGWPTQYFCYSSPLCASAFSSQYVMPISRYIVVAVARCSWACSRLSVR